MNFICFYCEGKKDSGTFFDRRFETGFILFFRDLKPVSGSRPHTDRNEREGVSHLQKAVQQKVINYRKPSVGRTIVQNKTLILMCLPAILFFLVFSYLPMPGAYIAFTNFQYNKGIFASPFVGLKNFQFLFISGQLGLLLKNTVLYNLAFIVCGNILQLAFAIMLNEVACKGYKKLAQSIMFLPYFISDVLVSLLVYNMLSRTFWYPCWCTTC